jgi:CheY-like chemotaxis protein
MDPPARIVIVEDESITALHLAKQLRSLWYQVVALANSGPRAIEHALAARTRCLWTSIYTGLWTALMRRGTFKPPRRSRSST